MLYYTPPVTTAREHIASGRLGQMITPNQGNRLVEGAKWLFDNGRFSAKAWTPERYFDTLIKWRGVPGCTLAVCPDVVGDAAETNRMWGKWHLGLLRQGYPVAYVLQDGCTSIPRWCDAVFVGGSTEFKLGREARILVEFAKRHGKYVHMGRVNSFKRLKYATEIGCDSADGTFLVYNPVENIDRLLGWLDRL